MAPDTVNASTDSAPQWVFGYGSLMWNPGFPFREQRAATLRGYHRSFCIYSHHYRGTPDRPGLVLGLDAGGQCRGMAFRVAGAEWNHVVDYLDERELIGYAYAPRQLAVTLDDGRTVTAHTYVADRAHPMFAGDLGDADSAELIIAAAGAAGSNRDYAINVIGQLEAHGYNDKHLHAVLERVRNHPPLPQAAD